MKFEIIRNKKGQISEIGNPIKSQQFDPCPMGCGRTTDDPYGGPCTECWKEV